MSSSAVMMAAISIVVLWGGFAACLVIAVKAKTE